MTRLRIMSDLHLEFGPLDLEPIGEDVLVLAGDVGIGTQGAEWAAAYARRAGVPVVMIAGNHEFYRGVGVGKTLIDLLEIPLSEPRFTFLENGEREVAGIRFLGTTLWTDYCLGGLDEDEHFAAMLIASKTMNDHRLIPNFKPLDAMRKNLISRRFIRDSLPWGAVVVTHHLPSHRSIDPRYTGAPENPAFASDLDDLVAHSGAALWVHGHTHASCDYRIGETRVLCNPRGYYPHDLNPNFDPNLIVEV